MNDNSYLTQNIINKFKKLKQESEKNKIMTNKLLRMTYLLMNNIPIKQGKNGGLYYYTKNNTKIYI